MLSNSLQEILEDPNILKVGVTPFADAGYLFQDFYDGNVKNRARSTLDLRYVSNLAECFDGLIGLGKMSEKYLSIKLDKNPNVRCSNWNALSLNAEQIDYAAKDALVAIELFKHFAEKIEPSGVFRNSSTCLKNVIQKCSPHLDSKYFEGKFNKNKNKNQNDWVLLN